MHMPMGITPRHGCLTRPPSISLHLTFSLSFMLARLSLNTFILFAASAVSSFALSDDPGLCGSHIPSNVQHATRAQFALDKRTFFPRAAVPDCPNVAPATANLNVHLHVVYANETYEGGFLSDDQIATQMTFLNSEWGKFIPLTFTLVNTTRTLNEEGFLYAREKVSDIRTNVVTTLHTGGALDINVYTVSFSLVPDLRGFSSFPWDYKNATVDDGSSISVHYFISHTSDTVACRIFIKWNSLPGGSLNSNGGSLVHEVGHWLGLYHTWQDGCDPTNDDVDDTPAEDPINAMRGLQTCPASFDSCPKMPGQDPIHNYMTYASDDCRTEFTKGQVARVLEQSGTYRSLTLACPSTTSGGVSAGGAAKTSSGSALASSSTAAGGETTTGTGTSGALSLARPWAGMVAGVVGLAGVAFVY
ncbi:hypothetical protein B0H13DRAFT_2678210 [Mycena leptocephala]|nr:hypothetical protein B0H13DRAFT_2678210 [Mycena leptocephala]